MFTIFSLEVLKDAWFGEPLLFFSERDAIIWMKEVIALFLVTSEQMRSIDYHTIQHIGIPAAVLMENAGRAVAEEVRKLIMAKGSPNPKPWLILIGKGNNGGDGIVAARQLAQMNVKADLLYAIDPLMLKGDAALQRDIAECLGIASSTYAPGAVHWHAYSGIVDGLLGTGSSGTPREPYAALIQEANESGLPIVSIDIPSGMNANTGEVSGQSIRATVTVALAFAKIGLYQYPGADYAGEVIVRPIGIPEALAGKFEVNSALSDRASVLRRFGYDLPLARPGDAHKGTFGHALIVAGSLKYSGAGWLAAKAALRAGAGLVTWTMPARLVQPMIGKLPEAILLGANDSGTGSWTAASAEDVIQAAADKEAIAVGPGLGRFEQDARWLHRIWTHTQCPLVIDADALNIMADADALNAWERRAAPVVLTPHPGEMARLAGIPTREVQRDRVGLARRFARKFGISLVLKGARSVVALPSGEVFINSTGNSGMATGGSGDVLSGIIAGLAAQGIPLEAAAVIGVYMHGEAGDRAAASRASTASLLSGDIIEAL
jgi:ADP-dependent NAD(P)H-hydrate dehydratase / NAD(P)H-hydrate epimerase